LPRLNSAAPSARARAACVSCATERRDEASQSTGKQTRHTGRQTCSRMVASERLHASSASVWHVKSRNLQHLRTPAGLLSGSLERRCQRILEALRRGGDGAQPRARALEARLQRCGREAAVARVAPPPQRRQRCSRVGQVRRLARVGVNSPLVSIWIARGMAASALDGVISAATRGDAQLERFNVSADLVHAVALLLPLLRILRARAAA
jgi:hypothetical protein